MSVGAAAGGGGRMEYPIQGKVTEKSQEDAITQAVNNRGSSHHALLGSDSALLLIAVAGAKTPAHQRLTRRIGKL
jgi:hypothetical protein